MRRIFLVIHPEGHKIACSSISHATDVLQRQGISFEEIMHVHKEYKKVKPKPFVKDQEFASFTIEVKGYKIEAIQLLSGSRWFTLNNL